MTTTKLRIERTYPLILARDNSRQILAKYRGKETDNVDFVYADSRNEVVACHSRLSDKNSSQLNRDFLYSRGTHPSYGSFHVLTLFFPGEEGNILVPSNMEGINISNANSKGFTGLSLEHRRRTSRMELSRLTLEEVQEFYLRLKENIPVLDKL